MGGTGLEAEVQCESYCPVVPTHRRLRRLWRSSECQEALGERQLPFTLVVQSPEDQQCSSGFVPVPGSTLLQVSASCVGHWLPTTSKPS